MLTTFDVDEYVYAAIRAGASGFLLKDVRPADLVDAIRLVAGGNALLGPTVTAAAARAIRRHASPARRARCRDRRADRARARDPRACSRAASRTPSSREQLFLSETTVKTHVSNILRKLGVRDRVQAVIAAYDAGLVQPRALGGR